MRLLFRFICMFVYIQFVQIYYSRPHYVLYNVLCGLVFVRYFSEPYSFTVFCVALAYAFNIVSNVSLNSFSFALL